MPAADALYMEFGRRVRAQRERREMTQLELGSQLGLARTSISNIEAGRQHVSLDAAYSLAAAMRCDLRELLPSAPEIAEDLLHYDERDREVIDLFITDKRARASTSA